LAQNDIDTASQIAMFLAHAGHESGGFKRVVENLSYSAELLCKTWPSRFPTIAFASQYARQPEKIANFVYGTRMGNLGVASGDGWLFRGRGLFQTTGRENYERLAVALKMPVGALIPFLQTNEGAIKSAIYYWKSRGLDRLAAKGDIVGSTVAINGGRNGLADRKAHYVKALAWLKAKGRTDAPGA
jgi:putative chitinase